MTSRFTPRGLSQFSRSENGTVPFPHAFAVVLLALLAGCGSPQPAALPPPPGGDPAGVPPAQMRKIVEGLQSDQAETQYAALETLGRFPSVIKAHRKPIERLKTAGKDDRVRKKAAELLSSLPE